MTVAFSAETRERQINNLDGISFVRWDGEYKNSHSRVIVRCAKYGHEWTATPNSLLHIGNRCQQCQRINAREAQRVPETERILHINSNQTLRFVRWDGEYENQYSRAIVRCVSAGHEWGATITQLIHSGSGCPRCSGKYVYTRCERECQINGLQDIKFVGWESTYKTNKSKAIVECLKDGHVWTASVVSLLNNGSGCPVCTKYGFDASKDASLYALRSKCGGKIKIGISNNHRRRLARLAAVTPFEWECVEIIHDSGDFIERLETVIHSITKQADFDFKFEGFTEWRDWVPEIFAWFDFINRSRDLARKMNNVELSMVLLGISK